MSGEGERTQFVKKSGYEWVIKKDDFIKRNELCSESKYPGFDDSEFYLRFDYGPTSKEEKTWVNLILACLPEDSCVRTKFKLGLIAKDGKEKNVISNRGIFTDNDCMNHHCKNFITLDSLLDEANGYFKKDKLTIFCIIEVYRNLEIPEATLTNDLSRMQESGVFSAFTLVVGGEELIVHRCVLASRSPVFQAMLQHDMRENQEGRLEIEDLDVVGVKGLMRFLYTGKVEGLSEIAEKVLPAANKYGVERLKVLCEQELCDKLDAENVSDFLKLADLYSAKQLRGMALDYIRENSKEIVKQVGFMEWTETLPGNNRELFREVVCALADKELSMESLN